MPRGAAVVATLLGVMAVIAIGGVAVVAAVRGPEHSDAALSSSRTRAEPTAPSQTPTVQPGQPAPFKRVSGAHFQKAKVVPKPKKSAEPAGPTGRSKLAKSVEAQQTGTVPEFGIAMLNVLGSQHTKPGHGYASGTSRMYTATRMLLSRGVSVVGFSEIQRDQLGVFQRNAPGFAVYPGTALGGKGVPQSVAWNTSVWRLVDAQTISIPFSHQVRPQPIVRLANIATGTEIWVMNIHNSPEGMEAERDQATNAEIAKVNELTADGTPLVMTGDFNEKVESFCRFTASTRLDSAVGGTNSGTCVPPAHPRVDWIFATDEFTRGSYLVTRAAPVPSITDHAALFARLSIS